QNDGESRDRHSTVPEPQPTARRGRRLAESGQSGGRILLFGNDADGAHRIGHTLQVERASVRVADAINLSGEVRELPTGQDLARSRLAAEPGRQVEGAASPATLHRNSLTGVDAC